MLKQQKKRHLFLVSVSCSIQNYVLCTPQRKSTTNNRLALHFFVVVLFYVLFHYSIWFRIGVIKEFHTYALHHVHYAFKAQFFGSPFAVCYYILCSFFCRWQNSREKNYFKNPCFFRSTEMWRIARSMQDSPHFTSMTCT